MGGQAPIFLLQEVSSKVIPSFLFRSFLLLELVSVNKGSVDGFQVGSESLHLSHLQFVDDTLL